MITEAKIPYFPVFQKNAKSLISQLLVVNPQHRLGFGPNGIDKIKSHPFFHGINWNTIRLKTTQIPDFQPMEANMQEIEIPKGDQAELFIN